jgi:SAM-dependent methyltransferase
MSSRAKSLGERFDEIYERNEWVFGSGEGSLPFHNIGYIAFLQDFITTHEISSVVDMGCGDWQFSQFINWGNARYRGYDVAKSVIDENLSNYADNTTEFVLYSGEPSDLPDADLLIAKDVLQHLSNARVMDVISHFHRFKYVLVTNSLDPNGATTNVDIPDGGWRYLDLRLPPFNVDATEVFEFRKKELGEKTFHHDPHFKKTTLLVTP